jgi:hypothetical protein
MSLSNNGTVPKNRSVKVSFQRSDLHLVIEQFLTHFLRKVTIFFHLRSEDWITVNLRLLMPFRNISTACSGPDSFKLRDILPNHPHLCFCHFWTRPGHNLANRRCRGIPLYTVCWKGCLLLSRPMWRFLLWQMQRYIWPRSTYTRCSSFLFANWSNSSIHVDMPRLIVLRN